MRKEIKLNLKRKIYISERKRIRREWKWKNNINENERIDNGGNEYEKVKRIVVDKGE